MEYHCWFSYIIDPYNCLDHCNLAWLIRNNPHFLKIFHGVPPACSNGTLLQQLDSDAFSDCHPDIRHEGLNFYFLMY